MLDRTIKNNGLILRLTYNHELNRYKGFITNYNRITIYGDTANEVIEEFNKIADNMEHE